MYHFRSTDMVIYILFKRFPKPNEMGVSNGRGKARFIGKGQTYYTMQHNLHVIHYTY